MELNIKNDSLKVSSLVCCRKNDFTAECDVIVPDTKPDIARVLLVSARTMVTGCETQSDRVILSGTVFFNILYLADNEEQSVKSIDTSAAFSNIFNSSDIRAGMLTLSDVDVSEVKCDVANCRKLSVKATLTGSIRVYSSYDIELLTDIDCACVKKSELCSTVVGAHSEIIQSFSESFEIPQTKSAASEILKCDASISGVDTKIIDDKAIIKGTLCVTVLYEGDGRPDYISFEMPFAQVIDAEGLRSDMSVHPKVCLYDINTALAQNDAGEMRTLNINASLFFRILAMQTVKKSFITDAYVPHSGLDVKKSRVTVTGIENTADSEVSFCETLTLPDSFSPIDTVYRVIARPVCERCEISDGKLNVSGYTEVYLLYISSDSLSPVFSYKKDVDFNCSFENPDCTLTPGAECSLKSLSYVISGERSVEVRGCIEIHTECTRETETDVIYNAESALPEPQNRASVIISFLSDGQRLWDIAKEYNISPEDILKANGVEEEDSLMPGAALIIPR